MTELRTSPVRTPAARASIRSLLPGLVVCAVVVAIGFGIRELQATISPLLSCLLLGIVLANVGVLRSAALQPGLRFAATKLLRLGVVLLGLSIAFRDVLGLGVGPLLLVVAVVACGLTGGLALGKALGLRRGQAMLIAFGCSICGAAAVAAAADVVDHEEDDVASAVAMVAVFGTVMIALIPTLGLAMGLSDEATALWAGASVHEVAQVVAVGGALGGTALAIAVLVKLARVMLLAPAMAVVARGTAGRGVPLFVLGFLAMIAVRALVPLPDQVLEIAAVVQVAALSAAMFAIGAAVRVSQLKKLGWRPIAAGAGTTVLVTGVALAGTLVVTSL